MRIPFDVTDPSVFEFLTLRMRYDDGFVAYLNGIEVASQNAPASPIWNSTALSDRDSAEAFQFEEIDLSSSLGLLNTGTNVLAIRMLNSSANDPDFFLQPQLITARTDVNHNVYMTTPTPGSANDSDWYIDRVEPHSILRRARLLRQSFFRHPDFAHTRNTDSIHDGWKPAPPRPVARFTLTRLKSPTPPCCAPSPTATPTDQPMSNPTPTFFAMTSSPHP